MTRPKFAPGSNASFHVKNRSGKKKLAEYLAARIGVVAPWAADLIARGCVRLDGETATPETEINLSAGPHDIDVSFPLSWPKHMAATEMPLNVIYEDRHLAVLDKPPGIVVHPARGHLDNKTLQNGVRYRYRHLLGLEETTIGPAHRLDKDTSGCIVFALTRSAYIHLAAQFAASAPRKEYLAIVDGTPDFTSVSCREPVGVDPSRKGCGMIAPESGGGKAARTDFALLEKGDGWALLRAAPHTGRPHQIRIHAASLGLPLAGDAEYNPNPGRLGFARQALHAAVLAFVHPERNETVRVVAPLPEDMRAGLERLRGSIINQAPRA